MANDNEVPEVFVDSIGEINVLAGVVRIDLVTLSTRERDANNQPKSTVRHRLVMPLEGFLRSLAVQDNILRKMADAGLVTINRQPAQATANPQPPPAAPSNTDLQ